MILFRSLSHFHSCRLYRWLGVAAIALVVLLLAGCAETGQMQDQSRYDPLEPSGLFADGRSARPVQPGAVSYHAETSVNAPELTGLTDTGDPYQGWPVTVDEALVQRGQERYIIFCVPCHGATGEGNGMAVQYKFPKPPSLLEVNNLSNGDIFTIIQNGRGNMYPYGYRVKPDERWAVIAYIRALQIKNGQVTPPDITPELINQIGAQQ